MFQRTLVYKYLFETLLTILQGTYLGAELLGHVVTLCLPFWGTTKLFSHPYKDLLCSSLPLPNFSYPIRCGLVSLGFNFISWMTNDAEHLSVVLCLLKYPLWRNVYSSYLPNFWLGSLSFCCSIVGPVYIFWLSNSYQILDLQIISPIS